VAHSLGVDLLGGGLLGGGRLAQVHPEVQLIAEPLPEAVQEPALGPDDGALAPGPPGDAVVPGHEPVVGFARANPDKGPTAKVEGDLSH